MTQTEIDFLNPQTPQARRRDPEESHEAAKGVGKEGAKNSETWVLALMSARAYGKIAQQDWTDEELLEATDERLFSPSRLRTARKSLERQGLIERVSACCQYAMGAACQRIHGRDGIYCQKCFKPCDPLTGLTSRGRKCGVWRVTAKSDEAGRVRQ